MKGSEEKRENKRDNMGTVIWVMVERIKGGGGRRMKRGKKKEKEGAARGTKGQ